MTERIAIIAWGAMADVLYATPLVRQIRKLHPDAKITWMIRDKFAEVIETNPDIDEVVKFGLATDFASRQDAEHVMDQIIVRQAKTYDRMYDLQYWPRYSNFYQHPLEDFVSLRARNAGLDPATIVDRRVELRITTVDHKAVDEFIATKMSKNQGKPFITVNHISYAASPVWSFDNYDRLVNALDEQGVMAVFTGAPNEPIPEHAIDARGMPYRQWADLIGRSSLWLGLDSGAVALACSTEVPIIKLHSRDFPLAKTGIKAMGLRRDDNVLELCPAPNVETMAQLITSRRR